jgi:hypothetical protein
MIPSSPESDKIKDDMFFTTSAAEQTAILISAAFKAGKSFIPSPVLILSSKTYIPTINPFFRYSDTM